MQPSLPELPALFNLNALVGRSVYAPNVDFPTLADLVSHLDALGIDRSLVCHNEARELNPTRGNQGLLRALETSPYADRLAPAFGISPACADERGALAFLKANLDAGRVRVLTIFPDLGRYPVRLLERVLAELRPWRPAILWNVAADSDANLREFGDLAGAFPEMTFICARGGMFGFGSVLDLMWRHANVCIDVVHMTDYIPMIVERHGADRVFFGIGRKAHYGAEIAALAHYSVTDAQRDAIGHGNLERLTGWPPVAGKRADNSALNSQKPLWERFRRGLPIEGETVMDAHGHIGPISLGWHMRDTTLEAQRTRMLAQMDRLGVGRSVVSATAALFGDPLEGNREVEAALSAWPDRFSGYVVFHPGFREVLTPELDAFFNRGFFVGFKILPVYWNVPVTDAGYEPVWDYAERHRLPILIHTWEDNCNAPAMLDDIVRRHPHASFLLGHSGGTDAGRLEAEALARAYPNVFLEFCGTFVAARAFDQSMDVVGDARVVFGSDSWGHDLAWELGRYLSLPIPDARLRPGLGATFGTLSQGFAGANTKSSVSRRVSNA